MKRDSVVIYRNLFEALQGVSDKSYKRIMNAILKYSMDGEESELAGVERAVFQLAKTQIDANNKKYENGKLGAEYGRLGGRPKKEEINEKPQENPTETPNQPLNDKCKMLNDNNLKESKKESKEDIFKNHSSCERETYDQIIADMEFSKPVELKIKEFIKHCLANGHVLINSELEGMLVQLDLAYENDEQRLRALDDTIKFGYFGLRRGA